MLDRLEDIARRIEALDASAGAAALLAGARAAFDEDIVTVTLVGEYNSGKSTLLNLFAGTPIVPVGRFPETGAICSIRRGSVESAVGQWAASRRPVGATLDDVRRAVSITRQGKTGVELPDRVDISTAAIAIPEGVVFTDTPGINDDARMTRLAIEAAADADLLVYVLHSRQYLSMQDARLIETIASDGHRRAWLFVVNMFLEEESALTWSRRCEDDETHYRDKLTSVVRNADVDIVDENRHASGGVSPVFVCGRVAHRSTDLFGGRSLCGAIERCVRSGRSDLRERRRRRLVHTCARQLEELASLRSRVAQAEHERGEAAHVAYAEALEARRSFVAAADKDVSSAVARFTAEVAAIPSAINAQIGASNLKRDDSYQRDVNRRLQALAKQVAEELVMQVHRAAKVYVQEIRCETLVRDVTRLLTPPEAHVEVPDVAMTGDGAVAGLIAGAAAGSVFPVIGTVFGALGGAILGLVSSSNNAIEKDVAGLKQRVADATQAAAATISSRRSQVVAVFESAASPEPAVIDPPDQTAARAWRDVVDALASTLQPGQSSPPR